jgi:hypothetical protein
MVESKDDAMANKTKKTESEDPGVDRVIEARNRHHLRS